ncbi:Hypothetical Protein RradSPS_2668 [Rubrobacter radiotolerans]|uniref:Uncharacterized protein n=1 Tax=Rubrobacter radiotolerans TaxID=42256 RepID=A0A023X6V7_RUBRA|nr:hypothetical protein [Rubrobacter radiotolerans]AHY47951.1 Hypothetical Protein RradSPS_2668 [Rubrobacter radiotolerans]MDX5892589.1 hypothetical protein [Rubrobacter radiotolerans]SMC07885.1 conserved hypothetical protein [Rubrobacter radiotolerans DSM 5868]
MKDGEELIGLNGAAALLGVSPEEVRGYVARGMISAHPHEGGYRFSLSEVMGFNRPDGPPENDDTEDDTGEETSARQRDNRNSSEQVFGDFGDEEVFEGEVMGDEAPDSSSQSSSTRLPAVPFERYERLLQQGQDYKTRLEERNRQMEEIRLERDAARTEIDRLWTEIERLNLIEYQRELQEKTISTLEEEKRELAAERDRIAAERLKLIEEKSAVSEEKTRLEAELKVLQSRGFWSRLFGGG